MTHLGNDNVGGPGGGRAIQSIYNGAVQVITSSGTHQESSAFAATTTVIRLVAKTNAIYYKIGPAPVADTTSSSWLPAGVVEYPQVCRGDIISILQDTAAAVVNITEGK